MSEHFDAFSISPVPAPGPGVQAPDLFRGIYGMPMFVTVPTSELEASSRFWREGLGFFEIFSLPGQMIHLRRWAFQDVLLVTGSAAEHPGPATVSFACVESQIAEIASSCYSLLPGTAPEPTITPWGTLDLTVTTPENTAVIMTAAQPYDAGSEHAQTLREMGIEGPHV